MHRCGSLIIIAFALSIFGCNIAENTERVDPTTPAFSLTETININTANRDELRRIPFIGERLAEEIIRHRETYGPFRRPEHLMLLKGISDDRFRQIRHLVRTN